MSKDFSGWTSSGGPVEKAWKIHEELVEKRRVLLVGEGEITTRYLKYIAWACATGRVEQKLLRRAVPVFLRLYPDKETKEEIESRVEDQLNDYGGIEDKSLASSFLRRGGFILILQDIEGKSMSEESRRAVEKFIDGYRNKNFIVVGSSTTIWDGAAAGSPRSAIESLADFPPAIRLESGN